MITSATKFGSSVSLLKSSGLLLALSGVAHFVIWLFAGGDWEGPVSWRKPILFGVSTGVTVLSVAWLYPKLRPRRWDAVLCGLFGFAMVAEVALITIQQWRGLPSHFNYTTTLDAFIESAMTYCIVIVTLVLTEFTRRCFCNLNAPDDLKLAIRGGMAFLILSCLIGFLILFYGNAQVSINADPTAVGRAGVAKFPHGVAIHAIQFFPLVCVCLRKISISSRRRVRYMRFCIASTGTFLIFSVHQTLNGRDRFDLEPIGMILIFGSALLLLPIIFAIVKKLMQRTVRAIKSAT